MKEVLSENSFENPSMPFGIKILISILIAIILGVVCYGAYLFFAPSISLSKSLNLIPVMCEIDDDTILVSPVVCSISYVDNEGNDMNSTCVIEAGKEEKNYTGPHRCNSGLFIDKTDKVYPKITAGFLELSGCNPQAIKEENSYTIKCVRNCANLNINLTSCEYSNGSAKINFERNDFETSLKQINFNFYMTNFSVVKKTDKVLGNFVEIPLSEGKPSFVEASFLVSYEDSLLLCGEKSNVISCE